MKSIQLKSHVGTDGVLRLETSVGFTDKDVEVILVINEVTLDQDIEKKLDNVWPDDFFKKTFGSVPDFPKRSSQGDYELREPLK